MTTAGRVGRHGSTPIATSSSSVRLRLEAHDDYHAQGDVAPWEIPPWTLLDDARVDRALEDDYEPEYPEGWLRDLERRSIRTEIQTVRRQRQSGTRRRWRRD